jgi:hypothetical protein
LMYKVWEVAIIIATLMNGLAIWQLAEHGKGLWLRVQILEAREVMARRVTE